MASFSPLTYNLEKSIVVNNISTAIDFCAPLSLIEWLQNVKSANYNQNAYLAYNAYLQSWFSVKNVSQQTQQSVITNLYINLFKNISDNFSSPEEKKYIENIDYSNPRQLVTVLPFFTKKIKQICSYYTQLREKVKGATSRVNLRGSSKGLENISLTEINELFSNTVFLQQLSTLNVDVDKLKNNISIKTLELYDTTTNYFDISSNIYDAQLFLNFQQATKNLIKGYPTYTEQFQENFSITLADDQLTINLLPNTEFIDNQNNNSPDNLNLNNWKELIQKNIGCDFYYLSTDSTGTNYTSGLLFTATDKANNYLNKFFPTITFSSNQNLKTEREIGSYFTPDKQSVANFFSFESTPIVKSLSANTIYTFPDPKRYGNISNLTKISFDVPFIFFDDTKFFKQNKTNTFQWGSVPNDSFLKGFYAYASQSEISLSEPEGISRYSDSQDFFTGEFKNIWAYTNVYTITANQYPLTQQYNNLLSNLGTLVNNKTDIYGNSFGLFKKIHSIPNPSAFLNQNPNTCLQLDGGNFGNNFYTLTTYTSDFTTSSFDAYLPSYEFYPATFCDNALPFIKVAKYSSGGFHTSINNYWDGQTFVTINPNTISYSSGPFIVNGKDLISCAQIVTDFNSLSSNPTTQTKLVNFVDSLNEDKTLYDERQNTYGQLYIRLPSTKTLLLSSCFQYVYNLLPASIVDDINSRLKDFEIVKDVFIFRTAYTTVFCPVKFNSVEQVYYPSNTVQYISANNLTSISNTWYNRSNDTIFCIKLTTLPYLSNSVYQIIYPQIYTFNNYKLTQLYPNNTSLNVLSVFSLSGTPFSIWFTQYETPILSYNGKSDQFCLSFKLTDSSNLFYINNIFFQFNLNIFNVDSFLFKPECFCHSENFNLNTQTALLSFVNFSNSATINLSANNLIIS